MGRGGSAAGYTQAELLRTSFSPSRQSPRAQGLPPLSLVATSCLASSSGLLDAFSSSYKLRRKSRE
jgi:hypothetical protein